LPSAEINVLFVKVLIPADSFSSTAAEAPRRMQFVTVTCEP
jgi:hypothetical protein